MKMNIVKKSVVNGVQECGDMTAQEKHVACVGVGMSTGVLIGNGIATTIGWTTGMLITTKVIAVGGVCMVGGAFGKAFMRGFREQYVQMSKVQ